MAQLNLNVNMEELPEAILKSDMNDLVKSFTAHAEKVPAQYPSFTAHHSVLLRDSVVSTRMFVFSRASFYFTARLKRIRAHVCVFTRIISFYRATQAYLRACLYFHAHDFILPRDPSVSARMFVFSRA